MVITFTEAKDFKYFVKEKLTKKYNTITSPKITILEILVYKIKQGIIKSCLQHLF